MKLSRIKNQIVNRLNLSFIFKFFKKFSMLFRKVTANDLRYFADENLTIIRWANVDYEEFEDFALANNFNVEHYPVQMTDNFILQLNEENRIWLKELLDINLVDEIMKGQIDAIMIDVA